MLRFISLIFLYKVAQHIYLVLKLSPSGFFLVTGKRGRGHLMGKPAAYHLNQVIKVNIRNQTHCHHMPPEVIH